MTCTQQWCSYLLSDEWGISNCSYWSVSTQSSSVPFLCLLHIDIPKVCFSLQSILGPWIISAIPRLLLGAPSLKCKYVLDIYRRYPPTSQIWHAKIESSSLSWHVTYLITWPACVFFVFPVGAMTTSFYFSVTQSANLGVAFTPSSDLCSHAVIFP